MWRIYVEVRDRWTRGATIDTYAEIAYRRKWWILAGLVLGLAASGYMLQRLPKLYRATTTILVTPQRLPQSFVRSTVTTGTVDAMRRLRVQILSDAYLEGIAREFRLVADEDSQAVVSRASARIRNNVDIQLDRERSAWFKIVVDDTNAELAAGVANRLAGMFIEENAKRRKNPGVEHAGE